MAQAHLGLEAAAATDLWRSTMDERNAEDVEDIADVVVVVVVLEFVAKIRNNKISAREAKASLVLFCYSFSAKSRHASPNLSFSRASLICGVSDYICIFSMDPISILDPICKLQQMVQWSQLSETLLYASCIHDSQNLYFLT